MPHKKYLFVLFFLFLGVHHTTCMQQSLLPILTAPFHPGRYEGAQKALVRFRDTETLQPITIEDYQAANRWVVDKTVLEQSATLKFLIEKYYNKYSTLPISDMLKPEDIDKLIRALYLVADEADLENQFELDDITNLTLMADYLAINPLFGECINILKLKHRNTTSSIENFLAFQTQTKLPHTLKERICPRQKFVEQLENHFQKKHSPLWFWKNFSGRTRISIQKGHLVWQTIQINSPLSIQSISYNYDGTLCLINSTNPGVIVWDISNQKQLHNLGPADNAVFVQSNIPGIKQLILVKILRGFGKISYRIFDCETGANLAPFDAFEQWYKEFKAGEAK